MSELHLAYAPGVMPAKWLRRFEDTHPQDVLHARPLSEGDDPLTELATGRARVVLLRYPEGASPADARLHVVPLYTERPVVCAPKDHDAEYFDELAVIPAGDAAAWPRLDPADYPAAAGGVAMMLEVVASGAGAVAILPQALARLHSRKDVVWRAVEGEPSTQVGLAWLRVDPSLPDDAQPLALEAAGDPLVEEFVGVVRGRRAGSSRQPSVREREQEASVERRRRIAESQRQQALAERAQADRRTGGSRRAAPGNDTGEADGGALAQPKNSGWAKAKKQATGTKGANAARRAEAKNARKKASRRGKRR